MRTYFLILCSFSIFFISCERNTKTDSKSVNQLSKKMVLQNGEFCYIYDFTKDTIQFLTKGDQPSISSDGNWIAFTKYHSSENGINRTIQLIDTKQFQIKELGISHSNYFGPIWSRSGYNLAFSIIKNGIWKVGIAKPDGSNFKVLDEHSPNTMYSPTWTTNDQFILTHDTEVLYKLNPKGVLINRYFLSELLGNSYFFSSSDRFFLSSDEQKLIFSSSVDEYIEGLNEPSSAIFMFDFSTEKIRRLSPKGVCAVDLWLSSSNEIYYSGFHSLREPRKIYQLDFNLSSTKVISEGRNPSSSK